MNTKYAWIVVFCVAILMIPWMAFSEDANLTEKNKTEVLRSEHVIYVPYEDLKQVIGAEKKGIVMSYEDFLKLWGEISEKLPTKVESPPVEATLSHAVFRGRVEGQSVYFSGELSVQALKSGWSMLPLHFADVAFTEVKQKPGDPMFTKTETGYALVLPEAGEYTLSVQFSVRLNEEPGIKTLSFQLPASSVSNVYLTIPEKGIRIRSAGQSSYHLNVKDEESEIEILPDPTGHVTLVWSPELVATSSAESLFFVESYSKIAIKEGFVHNEARMQFDILQSPTALIAITLPEDANLLDVQGKNIKQWIVETQDRQKTLKIDLFQEVSGAYTLDLALEKGIDLSKAQNVSLPLPYVSHATREKGYVAVVKEDGLNVVPQTLQGVTQLPFTTLPADLASEPALILAYRYLTTPVQIELNITRKNPEIYANIKTHVFVEEDRYNVVHKIDLDVRKAGIFHLKVFLPSKDLQIVSVEEEEASNMEDYRLSESDQGQWIEIDFRHMVQDSTSVSIMGQSAAVSDTLDVLMPEVAEAKKQEGWIGVGTIDKFKARTLEAKGLIPVSLQTLYDQALFQDEKTILGFRYSKLPITLKVGIEERTTKVTADVWNRLDIAEDVMKVQATVQFTILYAGISTFLVELPSSVEKSVYLTGDQIKEKSVLKRDEQKKTTIWQVVLQQEITGTYPLTVQYEQKLPAKKEGDQEMDFIPVRIPEVEREQGVLALVKDPSLEVECIEENLERIDAKELPDAMSGKLEAFRSFKYVAHPYGLKLKITKHEYGKILSAIVNRMHMETVVSKEQVATTELTLEMQNKSIQYLEMKMPERSSILSLFVDGRGERASVREADGKTLIPLNKVQSKELAFHIRMVYRTLIKERETLMGTSGTIAFVPPDLSQLPIQKFTWRFFLPESFAYWPPQGDLNEMYRGFTYGWDWGMELVNWLLPELKRKQFYQEDLQSMTGQSRANVNEGATSLHIELVKEGIVFDLYKLYGTGKAEFCYLKKKLFSLIDFGFFAMPIGLGWFFVLKRHGSKRRYLILAVLIVGFALAFSGNFYRGLFTSSAFGTALFGVYLTLPGFNRKIEMWRQGRKAKKLTKTVVQHKASDVKTAGQTEHMEDK